MIKQYCEEEKIKGLLGCPYKKSNFDQSRLSRIWRFFEFPEMLDFRLGRFITGSISQLG